MNNAVKKVAIAAAALLAVGIVLAGIGFAMGGNQPIHFGPNGFRVGTGKDIAAESFQSDLNQFNSIDVDVDFMDVNLIPGDKYAIEGTYDSSMGKPVIKVENGTLIVKEKENEFLNLNLNIINFSDDSIKENLSVNIYYPKTAKLKDVSISCGASNLNYEKLTAETITFDVDFGKLNAKNMSANQINLEMDSGNCELENITADNLIIANDFGKVNVSNSVLKTLDIEADSGDVTITDTTAEQSNLSLDLGKLTAKSFDSKGADVTTSSGDVELSGKLQGLTKVQCDMGKVTIDTELPKDAYNYELEVDLGKVYIEGDKASSLSSQHAAAAGNTLDIKSGTGDIIVDFM